MVAGGVFGIAVAARSGPRGPGDGPAQAAAEATPTDVALPRPETSSPTPMLSDAAAPPTQGSTPSTTHTPSPTPAPSPTPTAQPADQTASSRLQAFMGLSTWVDVEDSLEPEQQALIAADAGVQTIFAQSSRWRSPRDLHAAGRLGRLIEAAHDRGVRVVVWYVPDFVDLPRDYLRSQKAMAFVTPRGDRPDGFGLDIEVEELTDVAERTARLLELSEALRTWAGPDYPMAAIVLPPLQLELRPSWWPDFPFDQLRASFDVFIPMSYSSFRGTDAGTTYDWNRRNITALRRRAGDPELAVHLAGGIADNLPEVDAFVRAAEQTDVIGAGLYDLETTPAEAWTTLQRLRVETPP